MMNLHDWMWKSRARDLITYLLGNNFISKIGKYKSTKYIKNQS